MKNCNQCGEGKPFLSFTLRSDRPKYSITHEKKYSTTCKSCQATNVKLRFFGITPTEFDTLVEDCKSCCEICGRHESELINKRNKYFGLNIDHNHSTGKIRGILCQNCNLILGHAKDSTAILSKAIDYLNSKI